MKNKEKRESKSNRLLAILAMLLMAVTGAKAQMQSEYIDTKTAYPTGKRFTVETPHAGGDGIMLYSTSTVTITSLHGEPIDHVVLNVADAYGFNSIYGTIELSCTNGTATLSSDWQTVTITGVSGTTTTFSYTFNNNRCYLLISGIRVFYDLHFNSGTVNLPWVIDNYTVPNGYTLTGTLNNDGMISVPAGATVTLNNATINKSSGYNYSPGITCLGDATIILNGTNIVKGFGSGTDNPGIAVPQGSTLTIQGSGSLDASSGGYAPGIGGSDCGNIVISGGTITATGSNRGAGIGSYYNSSCGNITITGGTVTAIGEGGPGIGTGSYSDSSNSNITITGGTVYATGDSNAAGIGSGASGSIGNITITGGTVTARGGERGVGIGSGERGSCGNITITNTVNSVSASKGKNAPNSIGAGYLGSCGTVTFDCTLDGEGNPVGGETGAISTSPFSYDPLVNVAYTLYFESNGGTGDAMAAMNGRVGVPLTLPACTYTRTDAFFEGWSTTPDGEVEYGDGATIITPTIINGRMTLYAKWTNAMVLSPNIDNSNHISEVSGQTLDVILFGHTLYCERSWNTLCLPFNLNSFTGTPLEKATVKTLASSTFSDGTLTMNFSDNLTSIEAGKPYIVKWADTAFGADLIIRSQADWNTFAANVNNGTETYQGKTVKLGADITVTTMVGNSGDNAFKGTFDGCGHTLNLSLRPDVNMSGPFRYINGATIRDLRIEGSVNKHTPEIGGMVGSSYGSVTISNCVVNASINCSTNNISHNGGFISTIQSGNVTFNNCAFTGELRGSLAYSNGGFVGCRSNTNIPISFNNCLFAPSRADMGKYNSHYDYGHPGYEPSYTFNNNGTANVTYNNSYYVTAFGEVQGTQTSAIGSALQALLGDGWEVSGGDVLPKMTIANFTDFVVNPKFYNVTISDLTANAETDYADLISCYAPINGSNSLILDAHNPDGDAMHAALSIDEPSIPTGYSNFEYWCTDAARSTCATAIPFAADGSVTLYAKWKPMEYTITYDLDGGSVATDNPTTYDIECDAITLVNPTREGYEFDGWTGTDLTEPTITVIIPTGSMGGREYTATWKRVFQTDYLALNTATGKYETRTVEAAPVRLLLGTTIDTGWYVVDEDVTLGSRIEVSGTVNLILSDGQTMTVPEGISLPAGSTLNIYGQSEGTGTLSIQANDQAAIGDSNDDVSNGDLTIYGGTVQAETTYSTANSLVYAVNTNDMIINGGTISVSGAGGLVVVGISAQGDVTINGGNVSVTANGSLPIGINAPSGKTITLGWSNTSDRIYISSYSATEGLCIKIKDGQAMSNGTNILRGTISDTSDLNGKTLQPCVDIPMNSAGLMTYSSRWPLDFSQMTKEAGTELSAYIVSGYNPETHAIVLTRATDIPANTGLLLRGTADAIFNVPVKKTYMVYANLLVAVTSAETIVPQTEGDYTNYILANGSYGIDWYTLSQDGSIGANKAYLQLPGSASADVRALKWIFEDDATDIRTVDSSELSDDSWYTLDGRKLSDAPAGRGIYILNGKKVIIK